ncbi:MAG: hypothetical protein A3I11_06310 [Elusimicrobia bacterium RIFCSPLOWO2_02_FULL_39_32]|nr:MAG: hypothetical protein A3I11_06310 [Elusimicrobia bacterium RIFCSPLOWO2_02_FULL_39_32]
MFKSCQKVRFFRGGQWMKVDIGLFLVKFFLIPGLLVCIQSSCYATHSVGKYKCFTRYEDGDFHSDCWITYPEFIYLYNKGTYKKTYRAAASAVDENGTYAIAGDVVTFSNDTFMGKGKIDHAGDLNYMQFNFTSLNLGWPVILIYKLVGDAGDGDANDGTTGGNGKTLKAEVKVDYSVVRADGTVRADGGFDPEKGDVATFTFTPNDSEKVTIKIFSRHSEELDSGELDVTAGTAAAFTWDGRTKDSKNPVASGVYIVRIEGSGVQETRKIVVVK